MINNDRLLEMRFCVFFLLLSAWEDMRCGAQAFGFVVEVCCLHFTVVVCWLASIGWVPGANYGMGRGF